jgi:hypothetical protein
MLYAMYRDQFVARLTDHIPNSSSLTILFLLLG